MSDARTFLYISSLATLAYLARCILIEEEQFIWFLWGLEKKSRGKDSPEHGR